jgi:ribosomal protein S18 acetylase RimI-like enzyme
MLNVQYKLNTAAVDTVLKHLNHCNSQFVPALSSRISLDDYAKKMVDNAVLFEAWEKDILIGLVAMYQNANKNGYITNVSVNSEYRGKGIAKEIFFWLIKYAKENNISIIKLEVNPLNIAAINLYKNFGFVIIDETNNLLTMLKKVI